MQPPNEKKAGNSATEDELRGVNQPKIVVVGSSNTDLVVAVPSLPAPGETVLGGELQTIAGGKGANQAVAAARLGAHVTFLARVGDDSYGIAALAGFKAEGIDTTFVTITHGVPSGIALIALDSQSAENLIVVAPGANAKLTAADVTAAIDAFRSAQAVIVSMEIPDEAVAAAVALAHECRIPVIVNPAPARPIAPEVLRQITVMTPNQSESDLLGGSDALLAAGVQAVVTTLGEAGAHLKTLDHFHHGPGHDVQPLDTVAAGDCFTAALAVELARGLSLPDAVHFANAAAALKVTQRGAQPGLPTRAAVEKFLLDRA